jgi:hypothetical protein
VPLHAPTAITHVGGFAFTSPAVLPFEADSETFAHN